MFDEDLPKKKQNQTFPRDLEKMSVAEIEHYVTELEQEIIRAKADIEKKKSVMQAADSVFRT